MRKIKLSSRISDKVVSTISSPKELHDFASRNLGKVCLLSKHNDDWSSAKVGILDYIDFNICIFNAGIGDSRFISNGVRYEAVLELRGHPLLPDVKNDTDDFTARRKWHKFMAENIGKTVEFSDDENFTRVVRGKLWNGREGNGIIHEQYSLLVQVDPIYHQETWFDYCRPV